MASKKKSPQPVDTEIHPEAEKELRRKLDLAVSEIEVADGLPAIGSSKAAWEFSCMAARLKPVSLGDGDAYGILYATVSSSLPKDSEKGQQGLLSEFVAPKQLEALKDHVIEEIKSFPRTYSTFLVFENATFTATDPIQFGSNIRLFKIGPADPLLTYKQDNRFRTLLTMLGHPEAAFKEGQVLLEITTTGYARNNVEDSAALESVSLLKQLIVLGRVVELFKYEKRWSAWGGRAGTRLVVIDKGAQSGMAFPIDLPPDAGEYLAGISINPVLDEHLPFWVSKIGSLLAQPIENSDAAPIRTAAEWAFDSLATPNETVSFIQLCVALEAILGDEQASSDLTKKLADRCAYLIGPNAKTRREIRDSFETLYDQRSKLVHGRRIRLDSDGVDSLHWGRFILDRILKKELRSFE